MKFFPKINPAFLFLLFLIYIVILKFAAIHQLGFLGDEPNDFRIMLEDYGNADNFFENSREQDQSRLSHIITLPVVAAFSQNPLFYARTLSILIHVCFLVVFLKTLRLKFSSKQSYYCAILAGISTYVFSFSIFTMTTSGNLYLLFGMSALYYYIKHFEMAGARDDQWKIIRFSLLLGLCIASKLFGVLILLSIFIHDLIVKHHGRVHETGMKTRPFKLPILWINIFFILSIALINFLPDLRQYRLIICLVFCMLFLTATLLIQQHREEHTLSFICKWMTILFTAFNYTIIFSPIYLNFSNIWAVFSWMGEWNIPDLVINPSKWDIIRIIAIKYGIVSILMALFSLFLLYKYHLLKRMFKECSLFIILFVVITSFLMIPDFVLAWYPIFIFHFLFIPISYLIVLLPITKNRILYWAIIGICILYPVYEHSRTYGLFPYGHIDGAQYGREYIGWSKPGFISFEGIPLLYDYLDTHKNSLPPGFVGCNMVESDYYNHWAIVLLDEYFQTRGLKRYVFCNAKRSLEGFTYYVTTNYTPQAEIMELKNRYEELSEFRICSILIGVLWRMK